MSASLYFRVSYAWHAPLFGVYNMKTGSYDEIGVPGLYGRETPFGAEYTALATMTGGKLLTDSSVEVGPFYPETLFVFGQVDESDTRPLRHKIIRAFALRLLSKSPGDLRDVVSLRGYNNTVPQWETGIRYCPPCTAPRWTSVRDLLSGVDGLEILSTNPWFIEAMYETVPDYLNDGAPLHEARLCR